ncbi:MAG: peptidoglycan DD-metalloendopeptidase family protein [Saprospiraceae bacterium]|nr:peptidoglycan DD-metalloendopeptidase family protein [Saprospiraceae bacterium]
MNKRNSSIRKKGLLFDIFASIGIAAIIIMGYQFYESNTSTDYLDDESEAELTHKEHNIDFKYGYQTANHHFESGTIQYNQFLGDILTNNGVSYSTIAELESKAKEIFDVRGIKAGKRYHLIKKDSCQDAALAFVYEPDPLRYVIYDFQDSVSIKVVDKKFNVVIESASGEITSSLWKSMTDQNINPRVIDLMEDALASSVSFYHTQVGDRFKVIYERKYIDGEPVSLGKMIGAFYQNKHGEYYSVYYENDLYTGFYDMEGRPSKKAFLKSPIKGSARISSRFNRRRLHPIKKRRIPHLGTDYAADYGTPIMAVADGVITKASYTKNNGRFVKMKHDKTYETQYLHMQRIAKGIRPGVNVSQGTTIGYVGSTGLATGPHVCFRFWKNKKQIDHLRENFPPAEPMPEEELPGFYAHRDIVKAQLDNIPFPGEEKLVLEGPLPQL